MEANIMKKLLTLASVMVLPAVLAGCSSSNPDASKGSGAASERTYTNTTAKPTGDLATLRWGVPASEPPTLDWIYDWDYGPANLILANLCEGLTRQNPDGTSSPALASNVASPDDKTYVYTLRQGVAFTDGKPMTAEDVAFSLNRNLMAAPASYWGLWYQNVESINATGPNTVTVKLKKPDALFAQLMSTPAGYVGQKAYIQAKGAAYGTAAAGVMCTGPFSFGSWSKGQSITLKRNDSYWDPALKARAATVVMNFIPDPSALNSALLTGEVDGASGITVSSLKGLRNATSGKLYFNKGTETVVMQMNDLTGGPLKDLRIRQALRDVVDYTGITKGVLGGYAQPAKSVAPEATWGYAPNVFKAGDASLTGGKQDLAGATKLVAQAGAPTEPIVIAVNSDDVSIVNAVTAIQASALTIGLKVEIRKLPASEFTNLFFDEKARKSVNVLVNNVTVDAPDPLELLYQVIPGSPYNFTGIDDKAFATAITKATEATDDSERANLTNTALKMYNDQVYGIPLYSLDARLFLNKAVTGAPVNTLSQWYYPWAATVGKS